MQTMKASEFKAKCLALMDQVNETGDEIIITKNGVPVSKLTPIVIKPKTLFGRSMQCLYLDLFLASLSLPLNPLELLHYRGLTC